MIHDPANGLTNPTRRGAGRLIAIASGKGGVGKTWFAITLAHAMANGGRRTLLVDFDLGLANVDIQLGLLPARDLGLLVGGTATLADIAAPFAPGGFDIAAGRSGSGTLSALPAARLGGLLAQARAAAGRYDAVILDLGAGVERSVRQPAADADTLLVLATEEPTSLTDAYAVLKLHRADAPGGDRRIVVNQAASRSSGERTFATLSRACTQFLRDTPLLAGVIRRDDRVRDAIRRQTPLLTRHPASAAAADVEATVDALFAPTRGLVAGARG